MYRARAGDRKCVEVRRRRRREQARRRVLAGRSRDRAAAVPGAGRSAARTRRRSGAAAGFGERGSVDLKASVRGDVDGGFSLIRLQSIYKNIVITGGNNGEGSPSTGLYGDIRGWDARTGKLLWSFHTVPRAGEPGVETWDGDSWRNRSGTNVWSFFTIDTERGIVYAPLGSPTSDFYGGDRKGANLYGNSIVALDATTGTLKWFRQLVHHDLWDYDLPAAPTLIDVKRNGRTDSRGRGHDEDGAAVHLRSRHRRAALRPGGAAGSAEHGAWRGDVADAPFPIKPEPLARNTFDPEKDFYTLTPEHAAYCKELWKTNVMFTKGLVHAAGFDGTMVTFPSTLGGATWNGLSYDPDARARVHQRHESRSGREDGAGDRARRWRSTCGRRRGVERLAGSGIPENRIPCSAPPFGELVAVDVNRGEIAWKVPLGFVEPESKGICQHWHAQYRREHRDRRAGFCSSGRHRLSVPRVRSAWPAPLGDGAPGVRAHDAHHVSREKSAAYVVVAAGGGSYLGAAPGSKIVAFALPAGLK